MRSYFTLFFLWIMTVAARRNPNSPANPSKVGPLGAADDLDVDGMRWAYPYGSGWGIGEAVEKVPEPQKDEKEVKAVKRAAPAPKKEVKKMDPGKTGWFRKHVDDALGGLE